MYTYSFQNDVRDLSNTFSLIVQRLPLFLSRIPVGETISNKKVEFYNQQLKPIETSLTANSNSASTTLEVASADGFAAGQILTFESSAGESKDVQAEVTDITGTTLTIDRAIDGSTDENLVSGDIVTISSHPKPQGETLTSTGSEEAELEYNYTQIFSKLAVCSGTLLSTKLQDANDNALDRAVNQHALLLAREINNAVISGRRRESTATSHRQRMGGILQYIGDSDGNVDTTGGTFSASTVNNLLELIYKDGHLSTNFGILMNTNQARRMSTFNQAGDKQRVVSNNSDRQAGGYIQQFVGDIPITMGNGMGAFTANVFVDFSFPKDQVAIVDFDNIDLAIMRPLADSDATDVTSDTLGRKLITELSLRVRNGKTAHALAKGLTV